MYGNLALIVPHSKNVCPLSCCMSKLASERSLVPSRIGIGISLAVQYSWSSGSANNKKSYSAIMEITYYYRVQSMSIEGRYNQYSGYLFIKYFFCIHHLIFRLTNPLISPNLKGKRSAHNIADQKLETAKR